MLKRLLHLSDKGERDLKRAIFVCVLANIILFLPFMVIMETMQTVIAPLSAGTPLDTGKLWVLLGLGVVAAALYYFVYGVEYDKTYTTAYRECTNIRVEVAERMRRLPLSFFNRKDLSELTTNIMGDCATIEQVMSHAVPQIAANAISIAIVSVLLAVYDWRMTLRLREEPVMEGDTRVLLPDYNIELKDVTFAYNDEDVIRNMNVTLPQNAVTALVGPSGSGKSTISRLIARFWDVNKGEILIGGRNIRDIDPETLMQYMSFVFQDVVLFNDTVINNIRIGKEGATDQEVRAAAKIARCGEFIEKMENGYETLIGENGCTLSGGERQRISIARAILKDAPIVLLDEATASIDPENEVLIQEAISELIRGRTVIVIAHRLKTIAGANKIIVLDEGRLAEQGTHDQLLSRNGLYAKLWHIQQESLGWSV